MFRQLRGLSRLAVRCSLLHRLLRLSQLLLLLDGGFVDVVVVHLDDLVGGREGQDGEQGGLLLLAFLGLWWRGAGRRVWGRGRGRTAHCALGLRLHKIVNGTVTKMSSFGWKLFW